MGVMLLARRAASAWAGSGALFLPAVTVWALWFVFRYSRGVEGAQCLSRMGAAEPLDGAALQQPYGSAGVVEETGVKRLRKAGGREPVAGTGIQ